MWYILLGLMGFGFIATVHYLSQRAARFPKLALWLAAAVCFLCAVVTAWVDTPRLALPPALSIASWVPFLAFLGLFVYSGFLEVPLRAAYLSSSQHSKLVVNGTYSLVRHPGALWYAGCMFFMPLASGSATLALAAPLWIAANIGCVYLEEKANLKAFGEEYRRYQGDTPMLIPTAVSFRHFLRSFSRLSPLGVSGGRRKLSGLRRHSSSRAKEKGDV